MKDAQILKKKIKEGKPEDFESLAIELFRFQYRTNDLYKEFVDLLKISPEKVEKLEDIPCLPIQFFKSHLIQSGQWDPEITFTSSGTTGSNTSRHVVQSLDYYLGNCRRIFESSYGPIENFAVLALLPAYLERKGSSLIAMAQDFIERSSHPESGFFLYDHENLIQKLNDLESRSIPTLLLGVSFALLDLSESHPMPLKHTIIMETGGMKGRKQEMTREALHQYLKAAFQVDRIHSEYGMTELLSQAYSKGFGIFDSAPSLRILIRDITDPFEYLPLNRSGAINLIDLANVDSCAFMATDDIGILRENGQFEVLGRLDNSDIRGCNLLVIPKN